MARKVILALILFLVLSVIGTGALFGLDFLGVFDAKPILRKIPVVSLLVPKPKETAQTVKKVNPLEEENKKLKANLKEAEGKIKTANGEIAKLGNINEELQKAVHELQAWKDDQDVANLSYEDLAEYYSNMKAAKAAAVLTLLDDNIVIGILSKMDKELSGQILSSMDSKRAAEITENMAAP